MKKNSFKFFTVILAVMLVFICIGGCNDNCTRINGNYVYSTYISSVDDEIEGKLRLSTAYGKRIIIDLNEKEFNSSYTENYEQDLEILYGGNSIHYYIDYVEGYEDYQTIEKHLQTITYNGSDRGIFSIQGFLIDGKVYGIINSFYKPVGCFNAGGNFGVEEISHSVYFSYDKTTDIFTCIKKLDNVMIVAFSDNQIIYWKEQKFYNYDLTTQQEKFLCKDYSYDSGIQQQSWGNVYFNKEYAFFELIKTSGINETTYPFLFDFSNGTLTQLNVKEPTVSA